MKIFMRGLFFMIFIILCIGVAVYATYIERYRLTTKNINIDISNYTEEEEIRIVHFTDTQIGDFYSLEMFDKAIERINSLNPDLVLFSGDLIDKMNEFLLQNGSAKEEVELMKSKVSERLLKINAKYGKYCIFGNHDYGYNGYKYYANLMKKGGFIVLKNANKKITINNNIFNIIGADDGLLGEVNVEKASSSIDSNEINLLLMHEPDLMNNYKNKPIDIAFAGHSHGGQIYLPLYGALVKNTMSKDYSKGLYNIDNQRNSKLWVSSGLGNTRVPFRFNNIPEVTLIRIS